MLFMKNIIELLYQNYLSNPEQLALVDTNRMLTYQELYLEVVEKASYINEQGVSNSPILVKVNRSLDSVVAFFAILLSGNYYIPVDENIPEEKLTKIIALSGAKHYVSFMDDSLSICKLNWQKPAKIWEFSEFCKDFDENNYSYLMFTSGSTGEPKGVIKTHKNIIAFVDNFVETFQFLGKERIANQTPFFFDASAKDIYLTLKLGATLFIPEKVTFSLPFETVKYLNENKITYICWVPSILTMIAKTKTLSYVKPESLKYVFFVGEVFQPKYLNMWIEALPEVRYFNVFGSTEVMGVALFFEIKGLFDKEIIPTGKPIKNNDVYLEDGEIIISSEQVAKGYLNGDNKTFRLSPSGRQELATGDYGTFDEEGNVIFLSRKDYQIKHLGYRIELQEIEASLINLEYIDNCCAIYDEQGDKIILYATLNKELENAQRQILNDAKEKLQFYMVPNKVIILKEMPLNDNGKVDRKKLKQGNI